MVPTTPHRHVQPERLGVPKRRRDITSLRAPNDHRRPPLSNQRPPRLPIPRVSLDNNLTNHIRPKPLDPTRPNTLSHLNPSIPAPPWRLLPH